MGNILAIVTPFLEKAALALAGKAIALVEADAPAIVKEFLQLPEVVAEIQKYEAAGEAELGKLLAEGVAALHAKLGAFLASHPKLQSILNALQKLEATPAGGFAISLAQDEVKVLWAMHASGEWNRFRNWLELSPA